MRNLALCLIASLALFQSTRADEPAWWTDLAKAQAKAKEEKRMVLLDFTGSDWCPGCILLHKTVLTSKAFEQFAKNNLELVVVDFPHNRTLTTEQQKANQELADKFGVQVLPTIVVLDPNGRKLSSEEGYEGTSAKEFVSNLQKIKSKSEVAAH